MTTKTDSNPPVTPLHLRDFIIHEGTSECSGHVGIKNVLKLLKADVKIAFEQYSICVPKQSERLKELQSIIISFSTHWEEWSTSSFCNLTAFEVSLINLYRKKQDYRWVGMQLGISYDHALATLIKSLRCLKTDETAVSFQKWKDFRDFDHQDPEDFLDIPLEGLRLLLPHRVFTLLSFFGTTMREILSAATIKELRTYRNFGKKAEQELKDVLEKRHCLHLLK